MVNEQPLFYYLTLHFSILGPYETKNLLKWGLAPILARQQYIILMTSKIQLFEEIEKNVVIQIS